MNCLADLYALRGLMVTNLENYAQRVTEGVGLPVKNAPSKLDKKGPDVENHVVSIF
jgi:hypothetical protein